MLWILLNKKIICDRCLTDKNKYRIKRKAVRFEIAKTERMHLIKMRKKKSMAILEVSLDTIKNTERTRSLVSKISLLRCIKTKTKKCVASK